MLLNRIIFVLIPLGIQTSPAQTVGVPTEFTVISKESIGYYNAPDLSNGTVTIQATAKSKETPALVIYRIPLDGGEQEEIRLLEMAVPGVVIATEMITGNERSRLLIQSWNKGTGEVAIFVQPLEQDDLRPSGTLTKVGVVPLDPRSYKGDPLGLRFVASPERSKNLVYFDGIQSGGIKLAMCWVLDDEDGPIWDAAYRIPVQAFGANTISHYRSTQRCAAIFSQDDPRRSLRSRSYGTTSSEK